MFASWRRCQKRRVSAKSDMTTVKELINWLVIGMATSYFELEIRRGFLRHRKLSRWEIHFRTFSVLCRHRMAGMFWSLTEIHNIVYFRTFSVLCRKFTSERSVYLQNLMCYNIRKYSSHQNNVIRNSILGAEFDPQNVAETNIVGQGQL